MGILPMCARTVVRALRKRDSHRQGGRVIAATRYNRKPEDDKGFFASESDAMHAWCRGRWWFPRALFLLWFGYLWVRLMADPAYPIVFGAINLGIHELGHMLLMPFGEFMMFLGGSLVQCLAPVASFAVFYRQRDYFAMAFSFGWLSTNLYNLSVYISDARAQALPLVTPGGGEPRHDWHYLLGKLGLLQQDVLLGQLTQALGAIAMFAFMVLGGYQIWLMITLPKCEALKENDITDRLMGEVLQGRRDQVSESPPRPN